LTTPFGNTCTPAAAWTSEFYQLFRGNDRAYGGDEGKAIWQWVTLNKIARHLDGTEAIGIYPIQQRDADDEPLLVRWGCCDIDTGNWGEAWALTQALRAMGMEPWVERSRSKGWHIWVFSDEWVHAWEMRRALKCAYKAIDLPAKEANPKSEQLRANQLGNYVRLPYNGAAAEGRQVMMKNLTRTSDGDPMTLEEFMGQVTKVSAATIRKWAAKWYEPPRTTTVSVETLLEDDKLQALIERVNPYTRKVLLEGPKSADRSSTLQALAFALKNQGFTPQEVYQLVHSGDRLWGKFHTRTNGDHYIADIVERAFA
jgi:hypothetical protein